MLILLPPSEGKTPPRRGESLDPTSLSFPSLLESRAEVLDALVSLCTTGEHPDTQTPTGPHLAAQTLGLGKTQSDDVVRNARLREAHTARADRVYTGVLYEALDLATLEGPARRRATQWIAITSGLFGLVRTADHIPAYRLSGNVTLPGIGAVSTYWNKHLDQAVREAAGRGLIVDLRSSTYASFWRPGPDLAKRVATLRVLHEVDGTRKVVSHFNKATKGLIVRAMLEDGGNPNSPERFADQLTALGWKVEWNGTRFDVIVSEI